MRAYRVATIRALEEAAMAVVGDDALMQRAAAALAVHTARLLARRHSRLYGSRLLVLVGPGNNGGDALFAAARLARRGVAVTAVACLGSPHARGAAALTAAGGRWAELETVADAAVLRDADAALDGVLGIGGRPGLPDEVSTLADALATAGVPVLAVDLPSGVAADTGAVPGAAFRAERTVTFGEAKPCHLLEPARSRCGELVLADIGLDADGADAELVALDEAGLAAAWPYPDEHSDKYARGVVGVDTGSEQYPGAAVMGVHGAVHGGAGMVRFLGADRPAALIAGLLPNVVFSPGRVQARLFGSGWGERPDGTQVLAQAAEEGLPAVVDADGLRYLPPRCPAHWLLTPHAGELAAVLGQPRSWVSEDPVRAATEGARRTGATVLLKGASQLVADPRGGPVRVAVPGPAWTAQAGSGDVLAGICAALLAAGVGTVEAGLLGASVQAVAARKRPGAVTPVQLAETVGDLLGGLRALERDR